MPPGKGDTKTDQNIEIGKHPDKHHGLPAKEAPVSQWMETLVLLLVTAAELIPMLGAVSAPVLAPAMRPLTLPVDMDTQGMNKEDIR